MLHDNILIFLILSLLEIILGLDNIIFIALLVSKLPKDMGDKIRVYGLIIALLMRFVILFGVYKILLLTTPVISTSFIDLSVRDLIMILGGIFLLYKSGSELRNMIFLKVTDGSVKNLKESFFSAMLQVIMIDLVFSVDSILTAIAMTSEIKIIIPAFTVTMISMIFISKYVVHILTNYPQIKVIALMFIFFIGGLLVLEGLHIEISKNYLYFAFLFSISVETINILRQKNGN